MKLIKPSVDYWGEVPATDIAAQLAWIERAGRICYRSEDKIAPGTAEKFVRGLYAKRHWAMLEHSNFCVSAATQYWDPARDAILCNPYLARDAVLCNPYLAWHREGYKVFVAGSITAWLHTWKRSNLTRLTEPFFVAFRDVLGLVAEREIAPLYGIDYPFKACEPPDELKRYSIQFVCDRGVMAELTRHRPCAHAWESTRYCRYDSEEMKFVEPWWWDDGTAEQRQHFVHACESAATYYGQLLSSGLPPQAARAVLPLALATTGVITADRAEWDHIFKLRCASDAHPDCVRVMGLAQAALKGATRKPCN